MRRIVSGKKARYEQDGVSLDLVYLTVSPPPQRRRISPTAQPGLIVADNLMAWS